MIKRIVSRLFSLRCQPSSISANSTNITSVVNSKLSASENILCNLGCGTRFHPDWLNIDFHGDERSVFSWDLRRGLPLPDHSCDVIYSSHAIEHFDRDGAHSFLLECRRALKPGGTLRLVAPDLEGIVRAYLSCLEDARRGETGAAEKYDWIIIELLDQLVRHQSGGEMLKYWSKTTVPAEEYVAERVGVEYWRARKHCKGRTIENRGYDTMEVGKFRLGGEVHQWMYDRVNLGNLLAEVGTPFTAL